MDRRHAGRRRHADVEWRTDTGQRQHAHPERHAPDSYQFIRQQSHRQQQRPQPAAEQWRAAAERRGRTADPGNRKQQQHAVPLPERRHRQPLRKSRHLDQDRCRYARFRLQRRSAHRSARCAERPAGHAEHQWRGAAEWRTAARRGRYARHPGCHDHACRSRQRDRSRHAFAERRHAESGRWCRHCIHAASQWRHAAG